MECPKCKSRSVYLKSGIHQCGVQGCTYTGFHPISFQNDVRQFQDSKGASNRYSSLYSNPAQMGGVSIAKEASFDKQYREGVKIIQDYCYLFKICGRIQSIAQARYASILRIKIGIDRVGESNGNGTEEKTNGNTTNGEKIESKLQQKIIQKKEEILGEVPDKQKPFKNTQKFPSKQKVAAYAIYSACFQNELFFQDYNIYHKWLKISREQWKDLIKDMSNILSHKIDYIPVEKAWHYNLRVSRKRKIHFSQQRAMKIVCQNIMKYLPNSAKRNTIAACAFWLVCYHSKKYNQIGLNEICIKSKDKEEDSISDKQSLKYFDISPETVKDFLNKYVKAELYRKILPKWQGRDQSIKMK